jgi:hypothetical protein
VPTQLRPPAPAYVIRRLPTPRCEPPYDDESLVRPDRARPGDGVQGMLALSFARDPTLPAPSTAVLHLVPPLGTAAGAACPKLPDPARTRPARAAEREGDDDLDLARREPVRTDRDQLPDPRPWAQGFVQALTEVLGGFRPVSQLSKRVVPSVVAQVTGCRADAEASPAGARPVVRSVRVNEPMPGAVEVSATVRHGERCRALALRLEGLDGRWQCTALSIG